MPNRAYAPTRPRTGPTVTRDAFGRTLGDRLKAAMAVKAQVTGRPYREKELRSDAAKLAGFDHPDQLCTQQAFSKITRNLVSESTASPAFAAALSINALWLAYGEGPPSLLDTALAKLLK